MDTSVLRKAATKRRTRDNAQAIVDAVADLSEAKDAAEAAVEAYGEIDTVIDDLNAYHDALDTLRGLGLYPADVLDRLADAINALDAVMPTDIDEYQAIVDAYEEAEQNADAAVDAIEDDSMDKDGRDEAYDEATDAATALCDALDAVEVAPAAPAAGEGSS